MAASAVSVHVSSTTASHSALKVGTLELSLELSKLHFIVKIPNEILNRLRTNFIFKDKKNKVDERKKNRTGRSFARQVGFSCLRQTQQAILE